MTAIAKITILDEVNIHITGCDLSTRRKLVNSSQYFIPGARYSPAYKLGRWDGKSSFTTIGGKSFLNLLDKMLPILTEANYDIEIDDQRADYSFDLQPIDENYLSNINWPAGHRAEGTPIILRDYQVQLINECLLNPQGIVISPTASGKTIVTASLSKIVENYGRTIVIVPNKNLVLQTEEDYINIGLDVGVLFGDRKEYTHKHTICTWQSLMVLDKKDKEALDDEQLDIFMKDLVAVICDEVHGVKNLNVLHKLLTTTFANIPIRWGMTGTIPEEEYNQLGLFSAIGPLIGTLNTKELQDAGHLAKCNVTVLQTQETKAYGDYQAELKFLVTDNDRLTWLAAEIQRISQTGNTLVLIDRIKTGEILQAMIPGCTFISGKMKATDRKDHYKEINLADNEIMLATYGTTSTGINIARIFNLILVESGKSFVRVIQSIGRGLRKSDDKDAVEIYDICSKMKYSTRHLAKRKKFYTTAQYPSVIKKISY